MPLDPSVPSRHRTIGACRRDLDAARVATQQRLLLEAERVVEGLGKNYGTGISGVIAECGRENCRRSQPVVLLSRQVAKLIP
ncbi:MAG TPA: hypothetical protein VEL07_15940 [Planctomycetota bacterium]|nr:hypothetical protein [Planctomycetota bacterium]